MGIFFLQLNVFKAGYVGEFLLVVGVNAYYFLRYETLCYSDGHHSFWGNNLFLSQYFQ